MGLDYCYDLIFPQEQMWNVLHSVAAMQHLADNDKQIDVILPDLTIKLPFTSEFKTEPIHFDETTRRLNFDTSLLFEVDNPIRKYFRDSNYRPRRDKHGRVAIGYIYLTVCFKPARLYYLKCRDDLCSFSFKAATTRMSLLFEESPFIRKTFINLLQRHDGVCGIFDNEKTFPVLWPLDLEGERLGSVRSNINQLVGPVEELGG